MAKTHHDMRVGRRISIWLGNIADEAELDAYLDERFASDFGFEIYAPDGPEARLRKKRMCVHYWRGFRSGDNS